MKCFVICFISTVLVFCTNSIFAYADAVGILAANSIEVKRQSRNSLHAKEQALSSALRKAFAESLRKQLGVSKQLPNFSEREIGDCVYDCSIEKEKYSECMYICEVIYRFDESKVLSLLRKYGIAYKSTNVAPVVKNLRLAIYTDDFLNNFNRLFCRVEKFSSERVIISIQNCSIEDFAKLGIRYARL